MSDVVIQNLASNVFWLLIVIIGIAAFRSEIRGLLSSLGSFKVAGASFELKDSRATLEYYVVLTNIMVEILSQRDSAKKLGSLISDTGTRQLARFAIKYSKDVPDDAKQVELLKNVAMIIGNRGNVHEALAFLDALLKDSPHDLDILNLKANALFDTGADEYQLEVERIRDELVKQRPNSAAFRFNRALSKAYLNKDDEAILDLDRAIELKFWHWQKNFLEVREFHRLREKDARFGALSIKLQRLMASDGEK